MAQARDIKRRLAQVLAGGDRERAFADLAGFSPAGLVGPLFAALLARDPLVGARASAAFGPAAVALNKADPEQARVLMRRMMWCLNEESGAVGWGVPEAMGEVLAACPPLAETFHRILASYIHDGEKEGIFLDHGPLRRGAYDGLARLAKARPELVLCAVPDLVAGLGEPDPASRGLAAQALGRVAEAWVRTCGPGGLTGASLETAKAALAAASGDDARFMLFDGWNLAEARVGDLAGNALDALVRAGA